MDALACAAALLVAVLLLADIDELNDAALPFPACAAHALDQANARLLRVVADDEVNVANVEALRRARGDEERERRSVRWSGVV